MITYNRKNKIKKETSGGYAIVELLFYISIFAIVSLVVIDAMVTMTRSFRETILQGEFVQSGVIIERMGREIRQAVDISSISATDLKLDTLDDAGASKTEEFLLSGSNLQFFENGVLTGNLNTPNISITSLTFTQITTAKGSAVMISLGIKSKNDSLARIHNFYDTIVLRGNY